MMHSFEGLADEISTLLKNRGDTGDRGDSPEKGKSISGMDVTPRCAPLSPLEIEGCHPCKSRGDGKGDSKQLLTGGVTPVTRVTRYFEQDRVHHSAGETTPQSHALNACNDDMLPTLSPDLPPAWIVGLQRIRAMDPLDGFNAEQWQQLANDAHAFLDRWGVTAARLGWTTADLFDVHPLAPVARLDAKGLIPGLAGNPVAALSEHVATVRMPSGSTLRFNRAVKVTGACIWDIGGVT